MKRSFLLAILVGAGASLGIWHTISLDPFSNTTATVAFPIYVGLIVMALWVVIRLSTIGLERGRSILLSFWRQGLLFGGTAAVLLYVQGLRVISLTDAALIVLAAILLELFFNAEKFDATRAHRTPRS